MRVAKLGGSWQDLSDFRRCFPGIPAEKPGKKGENLLGSVRRTLAHFRGIFSQLLACMGLFQTFAPFLREPTPRAKRHFSDRRSELSPGREP
jgi:hypothetical protein